MDNQQHSNEPIRSGNNKQHSSTNRNNDHRITNSNTYSSTRGNQRSTSPLSRIQECIKNMTPIDNVNYNNNSHCIEVIPNHPDPQPTSLQSNNPTNTIETSSSLSSPISPPPSTFCADPIHLHSFQQLSTISSMFKSKFITCQICQQRSSSILYDSTKNTLLYCIACGMYIHRSCLLEMKRKTFATSRSSRGRNRSSSDFDHSRGDIDDLDEEDDYMENQEFFENQESLLEMQAQHPPQPLVPQPQHLANPFGGPSQPILGRDMPLGPGVL